MFWTRNILHPRQDTLSGHFELFNRFFAPSERAERGGYPAFNVWSDEEGSVITAELPGIAHEDLEIAVTGKDVSIKGVRTEEAVGEKQRQVRRERRTGNFERTFRMEYPIDAEKVQAKLVNGILEVHLPRAESEKPRRIAVN